MAEYQYGRNSKMASKSNMAAIMKYQLIQENTSITWRQSQGNSYNTNSHDLTHWGRDKMDAVSQTTLSNAFSWTKILEFRLRFHRSLFLMVQLTIIQHWFRQWLGTCQATSHYLKQWCLVYWRIYASLGLNELSSSLYFPGCQWIHIYLFGGEGANDIIVLKRFEVIKPLIVI